jgi:hypothetical protein
MMLQNFEVLPDKCNTFTVRHLISGLTLNVGVYDPRWCFAFRKRNHVLQILEKGKK